MTLLIKNVQYFEWELSSELEELLKSGSIDKQELIDEHFSDSDISVSIASDDYYEYMEVVNA